MVELPLECDMLFYTLVHQKYLREFREEHPSDERTEMSGLWALGSAGNNSKR